MLYAFLFFCNIGKADTQTAQGIVTNSPKAIPYILGVKKIPNKPESIFMGSQTSITNAISYVRYNKVNQIHKTHHQLIW